MGPTACIIWFQSQTLWLSTLVDYTEAPCALYIKGFGGHSVKGLCSYFIAIVAELGPKKGERRLCRSPRAICTVEM